MHRGDVKGDANAIGPERLFRLPTDENTVFHSQERVSFDDLCEWFQLVQEQDQQEVHTYKKDSAKAMNLFYNIQLFKNPRRCK